MAIDGMSWSEWLAKHRAEDEKNRKVVCEFCGQYFPSYYMVDNLCDDCYVNRGDAENVEEEDFVCVTEASELHKLKDKVSFSSSTATYPSSWH